jgi:hypothetical protein
MNIHRSKTYVEDKGRYEGLSRSKSYANACTSFYKVLGFRVETHTITLQHLILPSYKN